VLPVDGELRKRSTTFTKKSEADSACNRARKFVEVAVLVLFKFWVISFGLGLCFRFSWVVNQIPCFPYT
jgi:hypothetical protein